VKSSKSPSIVEDVPIDEVVFATIGVKNQVRRPVRETAITCEPRSGTIEIVGRIKTVREQIAGLFAEKLLGIELAVSACRRSGSIYRPFSI
jgi:hypothetical protein